MKLCAWKIYNIPVIKAETETFTSKRLKEDLDWCLVTHLMKIKLNAALIMLIYSVTTALAEINKQPVQLANDIRSVQLNHVLCFCFSEQKINHLQCLVKSQKMLQ